MTEPPTTSGGETISELADRVRAQIAALPTPTERRRDESVPRPELKHPDWEERYLTAFPAAWKTRCDNDPDFRAAVLASQGVLSEMLRFEAFRLIFDPPARPIIQRGTIVGWDTPGPNIKHLHFMLERVNPEEFHLATRFEYGGGDAPGAFKFAMGETTLELGPGDIEDADETEPDAEATAT